MVVLAGGGPVSYERGTPVLTNGEVFPPTDPEAELQMIGNG